MFCLLIGLSLFFISTSASATLITVGFDPPSIITTPGDTFSVDLIAYVDPSSPIMSFGLDIAFESAMLDTTCAVVNSSIFNMFSIVDFSTDGLIELKGFVSPFITSGGVSGDLTLASLTFLDEAIGTTALTPIINPFDPTKGLGLLFPPGGLVPSTEIVLEAGSVSAAPIPEPATILLISTGFIGFAGFRKKFRKSTTLSNVTSVLHPLHGFWHSK